MLLAIKRRRTVSNLRRAGNHLIVIGCNRYGALAARRTIHNNLAACGDTDWCNTRRSLCCVMACTTLKNGRAAL